MEHPQDRPVTKVLKDNLPGFSDSRVSVAIKDEHGPCPDPVEIGYRSFDRQWVIPDKRLINRPNPGLWSVRSDLQVYLTALHRTSPTGGPAATFSRLVPDLDHYSGRGGRAYPLYLDESGIQSNVTPGLTTALESCLSLPVSAEDVFAYIAAVLASPGYVRAFEEELRVPGLRIPLTADPDLFDRAREVGRRVLWLHCYGHRFTEPTAGRPAQPPRMPDPPKLVTPIPTDENGMPDTLEHDPQSNLLFVGAGTVANVTAAMRSYEVSGLNVLDKWFSYRRKSRERPTIGSKERSPLEWIQAQTWQHDYSVHLVNLLNVLGLLIELESEQDELLADIIAGSKFSVNDMTAAAVLPVAASGRLLPKTSSRGQHKLL
jgi:hypothetical protein